MKTLLRFLNANKTKLTGVTLVIVGSLQANAAVMQSLLTPRQFAWFMVGAGLVVALLGFLNNPRPPT